ncbi:MAG: glycosyltransferase family 2 protein [Desulfocucumaceae bacterium]
MTGQISIIIPAKNEGANVINTLGSIGKAKTSIPYQVIVVDDGSEDGCCRFLSGGSYPWVELLSTGGLGSARARNAGAAMARGDIFIFCDAHIFVEDNWIDRLVEPLLDGRLEATCPGIAPHNRPFDVAGGFTWDDSLKFTWLPKPPKLSPSPLLPGGCLAISAKAFFDVGGFDRGFIVWGREDEEISLKLWLFGHRLGVVPEVKILHVFRERHPYTVTWDHVDYNLLRMAYSHFKNERIARVLEMINSHPNSHRVERRILDSDTLIQRADYLNRRKRDDDWFFSRFQIPF